MKTESTKPTLPSAVTVKELSRAIDRADPKHPQFKFTLQIECEGRTMQTPYSGGIAAFLDEKARKEVTYKAARAYYGNMTCGIEWRFAELKLSGKTLSDPKEDNEGVSKLFTLSKIDPLNVCYSLLSDMQCGQETFPDFCANFGYDEDSRKALETYLQCQSLGADFRRVAGKYLPEIEAALQDY